LSLRVEQGGHEIGFYDVKILIGFGGKFFLWEVRGYSRIMPSRKRYNFSWKQTENRPKFDPNGTTHNLKTRFSYNFPNLRFCALFFVLNIGTVIYLPVGLSLHKTPSAIRGDQLSKLFYPLFFDITTLFPALQQSQAPALPNKQTKNINHHPQSLQKKKFLITLMRYESN
jgi:hypothetical protein